MLSRKPPLVDFIERRYGRQPPVEPECREIIPHGQGLRDGCSVVVIGAGIAGPAFAGRVITLAIERGARVNVTLISRPSCNYCGGLVTNLSLRTMRGLYNYEPSEEVVLSEIDEVVLINPEGAASVAFDSPLASVFRTGRFGQTGLDDNFKKHIAENMPPEARDMLSIVEPAVATSVELPSGNAPGRVTFTHSGGTGQLDADLVVIATGLRSINSKLVANFSSLTGYRPPRTMPASVTEVDVTSSGSANLGRRILMLNGVIRDSVIALIPKQENWITIAALKKVLTMDDLRTIFSNPAVREYIDVDNVEVCLPCNKVCSAAVFTGPAQNFYGDGWIVLGDLTGYGRVLKDGYFAALLGADLAAHTVMFHGCSRETFEQHYHSPLRQWLTDNRIGMGLFSFNNKLARVPAYNRAIAGAISSEATREQYGGLMHSAFRALSTGELSYACITLLFATGLANWALKNPLQALGVRGNKVTGDR